MFSRMVIGGLFVAAATLGLSGCAGDPDTIYAQAFGKECSQMDGKTADIACRTRPAGKGAALVSRYCYATIGGCELL